MAAGTVKWFSDKGYDAGKGAERPAAANVQTL